MAKRKKKVTRPADKIILGLREALKHSQGKDTGAKVWRVRVPKDFNLTNPNVHHPSHYGGKDNPYEAIKVLEARMTKDEVIGYLKGSVYCYNDRAKYKNNEIEDYEKALWFQNRLVQFTKGK